VTRRHSRAEIAARRVFVGRVVRGARVAMSLIAVTLAVGTLGYRALIPDLAWIDAFHQAAMLMSGMGPVLSDGLHLSTPAKLFDSIYAVFCGVALLGATGVLFAPVWHRITHKFRLEDDGGTR